MGSKITGDVERGAASDHGAPLATVQRPTYVVPPVYKEICAEGYQNRPCDVAGCLVFVVFDLFLYLPYIRIRLSLGDGELEKLNLVLSCWYYST